MDSQHHSQVRGMSGRLRRKNWTHLRSRRNPRRQCQDLAFGSAGRAAMQRAVGAIGYGDLVIRTKRLATSVAMELIAAGAEELAAGGVRTRADFEEGVAAVFVVLDRKPFEKRVAGGARGRCESASHAFHISSALSYCQV